MHTDSHRWVNAHSNASLLRWVRDEITKRIKVALHAVHDCDGQPVLLRRCQRILTEIYSIFKVIGLPEASQMAKEGAELANELQLGSITGRVDALRLLNLSLLQLNSLLDDVSMLQPERLLPLINGIRIMRGRPLLGESLPRMSSLDNGIAQLPVPGGEEDYDLPTIGSVRMDYQKVLLSLHREDLHGAAADNICTTLERLSQSVSSPYLRALLQAALAIVSEVGEGSMTMGVALRMQFKVIDQVLHSYVKGTPQDNKHLLQNLLFYIMASSPRSERAINLLQLFGLTPMRDIDDDWDSHRLSREGVERLNTQIDEAQSTLKRWLASGDVSILAQVDAHLGKISRDLANMRQSRYCSDTEVLRNIIAQWQQRPDNPPTDKEQEQFVVSLLDLAHCISTMAGDTKDGDASEGSVPRDLQAGRSALLAESRKTIDQVEETIKEQLVGEIDISECEKHCQSLQSMQHALRFYPLPKLSAVTGELAGAMRKLLIDSGTPPRPAHLDSLADVIVAIEYCLGQLQDDPEFSLSGSLSQAEEALEQLSGRAMVADPAPAPKPAPTPGPAAAPRPAAAAPKPAAPRPATPRPVAPKPAAAAPRPAAAPKPSAPAQPAPAAPQTPATPPPAPQPITLAPSEEEQKQTTIAPADAQPELDAEMVGIYTEEVKELLGDTQENLARYRRDPADVEALSAVRRSFHSFKGSGRMVGATVLAEMSWAIENMLNRVLEGEVLINDDISRAAQRALTHIPMLVELLNNGKPGEEPDVIASIRTDAEKLASQDTESTGVTA